MSGMLKMPSTTTLATAEHEIVPKKADEKTDTLAGPPYERPATSLAKSTKVSPPPVWYRTAPKTRKTATSVAEIPVTDPRIPWVDRNSVSWIAVHEKPRWPHTPGMAAPSNPYAMPSAARTVKVSPIVRRAASSVTTVRSVPRATPTHVESLGFSMIQSYCQI